jgi:hypothetical protein
MREKLISQSESFRCTLHQPGNIHYSEDRPGYFLRIIELDECLEAGILDCDKSSIGVDGTERDILGGDIQVGEYVEGAAFANICHSQ